MPAKPVSGADKIRKRAAPAPQIRFERFVAVQLHERSDFCWAVIGEPDGAIVEDADGALVMRLTMDEAHEIAASMNAMLQATGGHTPVAALRTFLARASARPSEQRAVA